MKVTLVRHATLLLEAPGGRVLVDPMLDDAGTRPPIEDTPNQARNPLVGLTTGADTIVSGVDGVIVTHLHQYHFDETAARLLPRDVPMLTQPAGVETLRGRGFTAVTADPDGWLGLDVARASGQHGTGEIGELLGPVCGFVVEGVYIAGDTIWCDEVADTLDHHHPRAVVVNGSGARFIEGDPIVMNAADVRTVRGATDATVVVVHLESINHCLERRDVYRAIDGVVVPDDGETIDL
jgi:L-ascorbate metabolism protein UlaG (beta-lactamase superfamily)